jgi:hypothetical protein
MLCFITPNILPICVKVISALIIFQPLIWVGVDMGKFLIGLGGKKYFQYKNYMLWEHANFWLAGCLFALQ